MRSSIAAVICLLIVSLPLPAMAQEDGPHLMLPLVTPPSQRPVPAPSSDPAPPPAPATDPAPAPADRPAPAPAPALAQPQPVQQPGPAFDPATGFVIDPVTGYLVEPRTGLLIEPGTGNLIDPATYFYTDFRLDFATGAVVEIEFSTVGPTADPSNEQPEPSPSATTRSVTPSPSSSPIATSAKPNPTAIDSEGTADRVSVGEHPVTRAIVIVLLIGLGVLYYAKLSGGSRD